MGSRGFRWSYAGNFSVLENSTNVNLAHLITGVQRARLDVHHESFASGRADVLGYDVLANVWASG